MVWIFVIIARNSRLCLRWHAWSQHLATKNLLHQRPRMKTINFEMNSIDVAPTSRVRIDNGTSSRIKKHHRQHFFIWSSSREVNKSQKRMINELLLMRWNYIWPTIICKLLKSGGGHRAVKVTTNSARWRKKIPRRINNIKVQSINHRRGLKMPINHEIITKLTHIIDGRDLMDCAGENCLVLMKLRASWPMSRW